VVHRPLRSSGNCRISSSTPKTSNCQRLTARQTRSLRFRPRSRDSQPGATTMGGMGQSPAQLYQGHFACRWVRCFVRKLHSALRCRLNNASRTASNQTRSGHRVGCRVSAHFFGVRECAAADVQQFEHLINGEKPCGNRFGRCAKMRVLFHCCPQLGTVAVGHCGQQMGYAACSSLPPSQRARGRHSP